MKYKDIKPKELRLNIFLWDYFGSQSGFKYILLVLASGKVNARKLSCEKQLFLAYLQVIVMGTKGNDFNWKI